jgi:hypothetical protein
VNARLFVVRLLHSAVFLAELGAILWLVLTGFLRRSGRSTRIAGLLIAGESAVFVANRGVCPLTSMAERYGSAHGGVSDIFLPDALARTIPQWSIPLVLIGSGLHIRNRLDRRARSTAPSVTGRQAVRPAGCAAVQH